MRFSFFFLLLLLIVTNAEQDYPTNYANQAIALESTGSADDNVWPAFLRAVGKMGELYPQEEECRVDYQHIYTFECDTQVSAGPPATSVHKLRPHDITVIGAVGDSLTAAFGSDACTLNELSTEYRGRSWPIGGDGTIEEVSTLANIIKKFSPNLKGYSTGITNYGLFDNLPEEAGFNTAISGARSEHMTGMTVNMIERMKAHQDVDFETDWKLVSIFIGTNDLCQYCFNFHKYSAEQYVWNIQQALDIMHREMPRTLVNVQGILRVTEVDHLSGLKCDMIHLITCNCAMFKEGNDHKQLVDLILEYQSKVEELIMSGRYDTRDDFTVVYQPFMTNTRFPLQEDLEGDGSYFAPDCFHFSAKTQATMAKELWNNMLQPVGQKSQMWNPEENIQCPTKNEPYIYTNVNSGLNAEEYPHYGGSTTALKVSFVTLMTSLATVAIAML